MKKQKKAIVRDKKIRKKRIFIFLRILLIGFILGLFVGIVVGNGLRNMNQQQKQGENIETELREEVATVIPTETTTESMTNMERTDDEKLSQQKLPQKERIDWNDEWTYASFSEIHDDCVILYHSKSENRKNTIIAINAGHGTPGGNSAKTMCHPDGSPKVTGGSTAAGEQYATAISSGMTFLDGTEEAVATLSLAIILKDKFLAEGYDVLMIRETNNCQIDNIARTVFANENADCHISLHYDSSENDKGFFYISVPNVESYRSMEPVSSHWAEHMKLGDAILYGIEKEGLKIFGDGSMELDLTQTSYSTIPSVDLEVGDKASDKSEEAQIRVADAIIIGVDKYFN